MASLSKYVIRDIIESLSPIVKIVFQQISQDYAVLVGSELTVAPPEIKYIPKAEYIRSKMVPCAFSQISIDQDYSGKMYLIFSKKYAIIMSGLLVMIDERVIKEKIHSLTLDDGDRDAFGEIMNQLIGSIMTALQQTLPKKIHLNRDTVEDFDNRDEKFQSGELFPFDAFFMVTSTIKTGTFDEDVMELLMPVEVAAQLADISPDEISGRSQKLPILYFYENENQLKLVKPSLEELGLFLTPYFYKETKIDTNRLEEANAIWIDVDDDINKAITMCKSIKLKYPTKKLILSSANWTKAKVIMASQFGADDIIAKPFEVDFLKNRILPEIGGQA